MKNQTQTSPFLRVKATIYAYLLIGTLIITTIILNHFNLIVN